jgi:hypothetical protein
MISHGTETASAVAASDRQGPPVAALVEIDLLTALQGSAVVITVVVVVLCLVTAIASVRARRRERRRTDARRRVRGELFERRQREHPNWDEWIAGLDAVERDQLEAVVDRFLRTVTGAERELFLVLARELDMGKTADTTLDRRAVVPRLRALARLSLLEYPLTGERLIETCLDDQRTREAAARLLLERREEFQRPEALGTVFLVWNGQKALTARGLETLYELNDGRPTALLSQSRWSNEAWKPRVLAQACSVLAECQMTPREDWFEWAFPLFEHDRARVRAGTIQAFRTVGWQEQLRDRIPFRALITDDDPRVRRATYRVLAYWSDERARELLEWAVIDEDDPRTQLVAVRGLVSMEADPMGEYPAWPDTAWNWIRAEIEATERRRLPQRVEGAVE